MNTQYIKLKKGNSTLSFGSPGRYVVFFSNLSGTISCRIHAEKVELHLIGLYDIKGENKYTIHTEQIHTAPHSFSDLTLLSIAQDNASLIFSGLIKIEKNAQKSHAYQKNQNLILSKNAFVSSIPTLEILADDVFCTHGSVSGPISKEQLYYLQTRGLNQSQAKKLIIFGFKNQAYDKLHTLGIKEP